MIYLSSFNVAPNGKKINSTVELVHANNLRVARWLATTTVDHVLSTSSEHMTRDEAESAADAAHRQQLELNI